jgi:Protein of unknown function (DUF2961)
MAEYPSRRSFFQRALAFGTIAAAPCLVAGKEVSDESEADLPSYVRSQKSSIVTQTGYGPNCGETQPIPSGATREIFDLDGPGVITQIGVAIACVSPNHLKELIFRGFWERNSAPSIEAPIGDFFGLNLGQYATYESAYLSCSPCNSLMCYFAMPYRQHARLTVTNEGEKEVCAIHSNVVCRRMSRLPADTLYFHAQYEQSPRAPFLTGGLFGTNGDHVFLDIQNAGHLMGITLGMLKSTDGSASYHNENLMIDGKVSYAATSADLDRLILGQNESGKPHMQIPFAHEQYGAPLIAAPARSRGRYCYYRWCGDNPIAFNSHVRHSISRHPSAAPTDRLFSVSYWYQGSPHHGCPATPTLSQRIV